MRPAAGDALTASYVTVILLLLVGLVVAAVAYLCAEHRAEEAKRARDRAVARADSRQAEARSILREARRASAVARYHHREAIKMRARLAREAGAATVALPDDIDDQLDRFLANLLRGL